MGLPWRVELFGGLQVRRGDQILTRFRTQKTALLLAYLAYHRRRTHPREALIELLWPEGDPEVGRHKLSVALSSLRSQLEPLPKVESSPWRVESSGGPRRPSLPELSTLHSGPSTVFLADRLSLGLVPGAVETDVAEFEAALASAAAGGPAREQVPPLARAVDLYRGPLLDGYYDEWVEREQRHWEEQFLRTLHRLIDCLEQVGELETALRYALRAVSADPLREDSHREVMRLYAALGQPAAAARQFQELERILKQELGVVPSEVGLPRPWTFRRSGVEEFTQAASFLSDTSSSPSALPRPSSVSPSAGTLESIGGAVPLASPFYIARETDREFRAAIRQRESLVLIKGARQTGKTSLLARGLQAARETGAKVVLTDFRSFNAMHWQSAEALLLALGETIGEQLDLEVMPAEVWQPGRGPNPNFRRYLRREVLGALSGPLVWGLDEVDRLFECSFGGEIFGMFRSWHNDRALDPAGPWSRLTLAIAYATEAHLFIKDENQSPFNVGTRLTLGDFTHEQVADLNIRYGSPLRDPEAVTRFHRLVGGHPLLVRLGLHKMATHGTELAALEAEAALDDGLFGGHLRRLLVLLTRDTCLLEAMQAVLAGRPCPTPESFYRLRSAGLVTGRSERDAQPRCRLYATYLTRHLAGG